MQRDIPQSSTRSQFEPLMLSIPEPRDHTPQFEKVDPDENPRTWSDQMREIDQLEDPERWDGMS